MIPKTSTDSVCGIAVRGQQEFFNVGIPKHLLYRPSLNVHCVQMHVAERQSIPNLPAVATQAAGLPQVFAFDSLKSLPHRDYLQPHYESQQQPAGNFPLGTCSGDNTACVFLCVPSCTKHMFVSWLGLKDWFQHCMQIPAQDVHVCIHACMHVGLVFAWVSTIMCNMRLMPSAALVIAYCQQRLVHCCFLFLASSCPARSSSCRIWSQHGSGPSHYR